MQIFVQNDGLKTINVSETTTIGELKGQISSFQIKLCSNSTLLNDDEKTLSDYGIQDEQTINVVGALLGGGKKRKKKVYTTPKKIKHKRTKVKLATLKLYKVDDVGKLERKRKECPQEMCGAGIFLSNHKDRQYCGKCGLTIKYNENQ